jgi:membrane protease YdiL (CAAX protease family)
MFSGLKSSRVIFTIWVLLALFTLWPASRYLKGSFPIFTVIWLVVPAVAVWRAKDAGLAGFRAVPPALLLKTTAINLGILLAIMLAFEPWSHTYQKLLAIVLSSWTPDTTFAWLLRWPRLPGLAAMTLYSGLVTLFGEELFFRGWLLQVFQKRLGTTWAIILQSTLFVLPNLLVAFVLPALQGVLYALVYTWVVIGLVGGWAASRTGSIWPGLISATMGNLALVVLIL